MNLTVNNYLGGTMNGFSTATINTRNTGISKSSSFSTGKSTKKSLNYNAKQISSQLIRATKSRTAAAVLLLIFHVHISAVNFLPVSD